VHHEAIWNGTSLFAHPNKIEKNSVFYQVVNIDIVSDREKQI
jgi:predicted ATPase